MCRHSSGRNFYLIFFKFGGNIPFYDIKVKFVGQKNRSTPYPISGDKCAKFGVFGPKKGNVSPKCKLHVFLSKIMKLEKC